MVKCELCLKESETESLTLCKNCWDKTAKLTEELIFENYMLNKMLLKFILQGANEKNKIEEKNGEPKS